MTEALQVLAEQIAAAMPEAVSRTEVALGELMVITQPATVPALLKFLRDDGNCLFEALMDVTAVDWQGREPRFDVVYNLLSHKLNQRVRVIAGVDDDVEEGAIVPTVVPLFPSAGWYEREVWDMFGIQFAGHPDLRRILSDYGFQGHPLRKDFPLTGYSEVRYDDSTKRLVRQPVKLAQEFRTFDNLSPWEGVKYLTPEEIQAMEAQKAAEAEKAKEAK